MTATLPINTSSPFSGLGTATATIVTAGAYTLSFKSFLPYLAIGSAPVTAAQANNIVNVTCAADTAGSKNSTWWSFGSAGDAFRFYVWYNINSAGVDPTPSGYTAGIEVDGATGATAATLATATIAAINAATTAVTGAFNYVVASAGTSGHLILTSKQYGSLTAAANGTASYGASFSVTQAGSDGTPPASNLVVQLLKNTTVLATYAFPGPTDPIMGGSASASFAASDTASIVLSSLSVADNAINGVKTIMNLFQGYGA